MYFIYNTSIIRQGTSNEVKIVEYYKYSIKYFSTFNRQGENISRNKQQNVEN